MEFLNPLRNQERYLGDPLAPGRYPPATLFAIVMCTAPLAFFEVSELPEALLLAWKPLISVWKQEREELHAGTILPIGDCPSGASFTGFCSDSGDVAHLIIYRELTASATASLSLPLEGEWEVERSIAGNGEARVGNRHVEITLPDPLTFAWLRLKRATSSLP